MNTPQICPECGADWSDGLTCEEAFHQMGAWELENPSVYGAAHHLMVLSYHLQHPHLYSPEGLAQAQRLLVDFLERSITPAQVRRRDHRAVDSGQRKFKIKGTPEAYGSYTHPIAWTMTARDVVSAGLDRYVDNIHQWARSILESLRASAE